MPGSVDAGLGRAGCHGAGPPVPSVVLVPS